MNNKVIAGALTLALLVTMTAGWSAYTGAFRIEVVVDTTIFLPNLAEDGDSTIEGVLEFHPGITGLNDVGATAIDTIATGTTGDWSIEMRGNVPLQLGFSLDNASPTGITVALWGSNTGATPAATFTDNANYRNLSDADLVPLWANNLADASVLQIWQRIGADTTAAGGSIVDNAIIVTSDVI